MIYKYFPRKPKCEIGNGQDQKYFTRNLFDSSVEAKKYLCIPYEPLYRVKAAPYCNFNKNLWEVFDDSFQNPTERRVWASFGLHGGAWERVTKKIFLEAKKKATMRATHAGHWSIDKIMFTGGHIEEYCTFRKATEHNFILNFLKKFLQNYKDRGMNGEFDETKEGFQWKMPDDFLGGIFYWRLHCFEYTISVLIKSCENIYNGIKLWGNFWKDAGEKRRIYKPIEIKIPGFPLLTEGEVRNSQYSSNFEKFINNRFDDLRIALLKKSILINDDKLSESYDVELP